MSQQNRPFVSAAAVALALALLNAFCWWYFDQPPLQTNAGRATDVIRAPGARKSQYREGESGAQRMDENGYNNPADAAADGIDILFMGSSHLEGACVAPGENAAAQLEKALRDAGRTDRVYNLGMSAHSLPRNAGNLGRALAEYQPKRYVIIETASVVFGARAIAAAREDRVGRVDAEALPVPDLIRDRPLFKNVYKQIMELIAAEGVNNDGPKLTAVPETLLGEYRAALGEWFSGLRAEANAAGVELILCYHPHLVPQMDGSVRLEEGEGEIRAFAAACADAGIPFVDLSDAFLRAYAERRVLPHGFANTALGVGHLNAEGSRMMAEALAAAILDEEGTRP